MNEKEIIEIYQKYFKDVYRFSMFKLNNKEEAQDVTSETFTKLVNNKDSISNENIKAWLIIVARNMIYNKYKKKKEDTIDEQQDYQDFNLDYKSIEQQTIDSELVELIKEELKKLNEIDAEIITLKIWEELKFEEIATITGLGLSTVKLKFYRSIEKVKLNLQTQQKVVELKAYNLPILLAGIYAIAKQSFYIPDLSFTNTITTSLFGGANILNITNTIMSNEALAAGTTITSSTAKSGILGFLGTTAGKVALGVTSTAVVAGGGVGVYTLANNNTQPIQQAESTYTALFNMETYAGEVGDKYELSIVLPKSAVLEELPTESQTQYEQKKINFSDSALYLGRNSEYFEKKSNAEVRTIETENFGTLYTIYENENKVFYSVDSGLVDNSTCQNQGEEIEAPCGTNVINDQSVAFTAMCVSTGSTFANCEAALKTISVKVSEQEDQESVNPYEGWKTFEDFNGEFTIKYPERLTPSETQNEYPFWIYDKSTIIPNTDTIPDGFEISTTTSTSDLQTYVNQEINTWINRCITDGVEESKCRGAIKQSNLNNTNFEIIKTSDWIPLGMGETSVRYFAKDKQSNMIVKVDVLNLIDELDLIVKSLEKTEGKESNDYQKIDCNIFNKIFYSIPASWGCGSTTGDANSGFTTNIQVPNKMIISFSNYGRGPFCGGGPVLEDEPESNCEYSEYLLTSEAKYGLYKTDGKYGEIFGIFNDRIGDQITYVSVPFSPYRPEGSYTLTPVEESQIKDFLQSIEVR